MWTAISWKRFTVPQKLVLALSVDWTIALCGERYQNYWRFERLYLTLSNWRQGWLDRCTLVVFKQRWPFISVQRLPLLSRCWMGSRMTEGTARDSLAWCVLLKQSLQKPSFFSKISTWPLCFGVIGGTVAVAFFFFSLQKMQLHPLFLLSSDDG